MSEPLDPPVPPSLPPPTYSAPPPHSGPTPGAPAVRISEWLNASWALIQPYWLEYVLAILVAHLVILGAALFCLFPVLLVSGPMMGGILVYLAKRVVGEPAQVADVFKGFRRLGDTALLGLVLVLPPLLFSVLIFLPMVLAALGAGNSQVGEAMANLSGCLGCLTVPLAILFGVVYPLFTGTFLVFALPLVMFRQMGAIEAIRRSIEIVKPQATNFLIFMLADMVLLMAANFVGSALLCVGALILSPLAASLVGTMQLLAYRDFVGLTREDLVPYGD